MPPRQLLPRQLLVRSITAGVLLCSWVVGSVQPAQAELTGNVNLFLGAKELDEDDWAPVESQGEVAVEFDFRERSWPVNMVVGLRNAQEEGEALGLDFKSMTSEVSLGVRKIWESPQPIRPYIGAGLALIHAEIEASDGFSSVSDEDKAPGIWIGGGLYFTLAQHLNLGVDLRISAAEVTIAGVDVEAGGVHLGLLLGYHF